MTTEQEGITEQERAHQGEYQIGAVASIDILQWWGSVLPPADQAQVFRRIQRKDTK
jgi:hypothetical protein